MIRQTEPLNPAEVKEHLLDWISNQICVPNPDYNNFPPCPFAKRTMIQNRLSIHVLEGVEFLDRLDEFARTWDDSFDMILLACRKGAIPFEMMVETNIEFNEKYKPSDLVSIFDFPGDDSEYKLQSSNGRYLVVVIQRRERLMKSYHQIYQQGYRKPGQKISTTPEIIFR